MRKEFLISKINLAQYLVYRLSFLLWRLRVILTLLLTFFLWSAAFQNRMQVFHYSRMQINTYILLIYILSDLVYSNRLADLANEIRNGAIINWLLKPYSFLRFAFVREATDKLINLGFGIVEIILLVFLLKPAFYWQTDLSSLLIFILAVIFGIVIGFFIFFCLSLIAFWSAEVWAPRFLFSVLIMMLSGQYFPLDILPKPVYQALLLTPFPYFTYLPSKIFLDGFSWRYLSMLIMSGFWAVSSYYFARAIWRKGMREFTFFGR